MSEQIEEELEPGFFIVTYTGKKVWPLQMKPDDIHIFDIAHALSNKCRYTGHTSSFYSVAEHCTLLAESKFPGMPKWKLMHDAAEAYLPDVNFRFKLLLPKFMEAEDYIMKVITERFDLPPYEGEIKKQVKVGDRGIVYWEGKALMVPCKGTYWTEMKKPKVKVVIEANPPMVAEGVFINMFRRLFNE